MLQNSGMKKVLLFIFIASMLLRLPLSILNREANDDHMEAIVMIVENNSLPDPGACTECFQPKLFYVLNAVVLKLLNIEDNDAQIICVQLINLLFSFFILLFTWRCIELYSFKDEYKLLAFSLLAFNPCLIGINVQATNDTLVILLGVMSVYYTIKYFLTNSGAEILKLGVVIILCAITKGSGIVIAIAVFMIFIVKILYSESRLQLLYQKCILVLMIGFLVIVPLAGGYYSNYMNSGNPFAINMGANSLTKAAVAEDEEPFRFRPGIRSTGSAFLTFRFWNMLQQPYITNDPDVYPLHRTSLWSQLYGRTFFMHFDQHPPSWINKDPLILNIGRIAIVLGLIPVGIALLGAGWLIVQIRSKYGLNLKRYIEDNKWIHMVFALGFTMFIVKYARSYPDFSTMKSIFLFPAIPSFVYMLLLGFESLSNWISSKVYLFIYALLVMLMVTHIADVLFLICQLA